MNKREVLQLDVKLQIPTNSWIYSRRNWIWSLCLTTFEHYKTFFSPSRENITGIYLIVGENQEWLYIGKTEKNIKHRIQDAKSRNLNLTKKCKIYLFQSNRLFQGYKNVGNLNWFEWKFIKFLKSEKYNLKNKVVPDITDQDIYDFDNEKIFNEMLELFYSLELSLKSDKVIITNPIINPPKPKHNINLYSRGNIKKGGKFEGWSEWNVQKQTITLKAKSWTTIQNLKINNWLEKNKKIYKKLFEENYLIKNTKENIEIYEFKRNCSLFKSPSGAITILIGQRTNGWKAWKNLENNKTLDEEVRKKEQIITNEKIEYFVLKDSNKNIRYHAKGYLLKNKKFIVMKNSKASNKTFFTIMSMIKNWKNQEEELLNQKIIKKENNFYTFEKNHIFNSCSAAACFLTASNSNGWIDWKNMNSHKTLDYYYRENDSSKTGKRIFSEKKWEKMNLNK